jgi:hypothetical protein
MNTNTNPCKECLVTSACNIECDEFIKYLRHIVGERESKDNDFILTTARRLRDGTAELTDTEIIYHPDNTEARFWLDEDREWGYSLPKKGQQK